MSMVTATTEIQIALALTCTLYGLPFMTRKEIFYKNFETSALETRTLQILSHQMNHLQALYLKCFPAHKQNLGRPRGVKILYSFISFKKETV